MRLGQTSLNRARATTPAYDRGMLSAGIVHLGAGAFHRAHQAVYIDDLLAGDPSWAIAGASLKSSKTAEALNPQDGLYTLAVHGPDGDSHRIIGSVLRVLCAHPDPEPVLAQMSDPAVRIVSLTVTEKGYCHDPATGELRAAHPDIAADLAAPFAPHSAPGLIVEALRRRRDEGVGPFSVMSCDNLPANGVTTRRIVLAFAALRDTDLAAWIKENVTFPSTMVDRIVPATTDQNRAGISAAIGLDDAWPVVTEPFTQWVIEDKFCAGRPAWEQAGAEMVSDVGPFETMKLRMLNGCHSTLAYLGYLAGHQTVAEVMAQPPFVRLIREMMTREIIPTLEMPKGVDLAAYRDALIARFQNPALHHKTWQIAMDGSQKLPQRFLGTIRDRLAAGAPFDRLALGVAAWMRYVTGIDEQGEKIDVRDPLAAKLLDIGAKYRHDPAALAAAYLKIDAVFAHDLAADTRFTEKVTDALVRLYGDGSAQIEF